MKFPAVFLLANASRRPDANAALRALAREVGVRLGAPVEPVVLAREGAGVADGSGADSDGGGGGTRDAAEVEALESAVARYCAAGWKRFRFVPLFFAPDAAAVRRLPARLAALRGAGWEFEAQIAPCLAAPQADGAGRVAQMLADGVNAARAGFGLNPDCAIAFGTPFANPSASAHCPLRSTHHKVRLGKVQCAPARSLCEIRPKPIAQSGLNNPAVVLVDHGSAEAAVCAVRDDLAARLGGLLGGGVRAVHAASMQRPSRAGEFHGRLLDAVLAAPDLRGTDIIVAMQFLFPGRHAAPDGDIAAICSKAREQHPERALRLTTLVGAHPAFAALVADRAAGG